MKIRNYAKSVGFEVVGKIRYMGKWNLSNRWYMDDASNVYLINICIGTIEIIAREKRAQARRSGRY